MTSVLIHCWRCGLLISDEQRHGCKMPELHRLIRHQMRREKFKELAEKAEQADAA